MLRREESFGPVFRHYKWTNILFQLSQILSPAGERGNLAKCLDTKCRDPRGKGKGQSVVRSDQGTKLQKEIELKFASKKVLVFFREKKNTQNKIDLFSSLGVVCLFCNPSPQ